MNYLIIITLLVLLIPPAASADWLLTFKDGTRNVWDHYTKQGAQYCTEKPMLGQYCVNIADVKSLKEVPAGTQASEYSVSTGVSDPGNDQNRIDYGKSDAQLERQRKKEEDNRRLKELEERRIVSDKKFGSKEWSW